jgi:hypothetical protein
MVYLISQWACFIPLWNCDTGTTILGATSVRVNAQGVLPKPVTLGVAVRIEGNCLNSSSRRSQFLNP